jgi:acyl carrier protein
MERADVLAVIHQQLPDVTEQTELRSLDSLALVEVAMDLEEALGAEVTEAEFTGAGTVGELVSHLVGRVP